jgi:glycosyltransferase involved in cell wall biosynthesis
LLKKAPFDQVVEFHTVGSTVGKQLAAKWGAQLSVVFDSPVDEQFYEMHGTRSMHWSRIVNSEKETLEAADSIMAYSPACEAYIQVKYKLKGKVQVLPCIIHKENTINAPLDGTINIAFIGSFLSRHKVNTLVLAFSKFHQKHPESKLQLIGYGVEWEHIKNKVQALSLSDIVDMPGFVSESELIDYKRKCAVAVMPGSNWYGSPLKLFEYAQSGIPFIAPTTKTVSSIFADQEHCLFIDSTNEENSLLEKLTFLYENPLKRSELATNAHNYVKTNFAKAIYGQKLVEVLSVK